MSAPDPQKDWTPTHGPSAPCAVCTRGTTLYIDGVPKHLYCHLTGQPHPSMRIHDEPDLPAPGTGSGDGPAPEPGDPAAARPDSAEPGQEAPAPAVATPTPKPRAEQMALEGPAPEPPEGWRAAAAVVDPTGVYLPDGVRWPLPQSAGLAEILAAGDKLRIGHPAGVGALVLTDDLCVRLGLDLVVPEGTVGDVARKWMLDALADAGPGFLAPAAGAGWAASEDRLSPETRLRRGAGQDGTGERAFDLVLLSYLWTFDPGDRHIAMSVPSEWPVPRQCAEMARRYGRVAQLLGVPWQGTARQVGLRVADQVQKPRKGAARRGGQVDAAGRDRGRVVTRACPRPELSEASRGAQFEPETHWQAPVAAVKTLLGTHAGEDLWLHTFDRRNAYLADVGGCELGYLTEREPALRHLVGLEAVMAAISGKPGRAGVPPAGLYRVVLPRHDQPLLPAPHPLMRPDESLVVWTAAPTVEYLAGDADPASSWPGAGYALEDLLGDDAEAWVFPAQGRLLSGWKTRIGEGIQRARAEDDEPVADAIKSVYTGFVGGLAYERQRTGARPEWYQPIWQDTIRAASRATVSRRVWSAFQRGLQPLAVDVDEVAYLSTSPDPTVSAPMVDEGHIGQLRHRKTRRLTIADRDKLTAGASAFSLLSLRHRAPQEGTDDAEG